ncbi:uncharacterized protein [Coffea arabica]|uniref:DNA topoisomerase 1-like n=1 Tax=Coffea arabica TaxID=13443 RepID=A0A6P6SQW6_COFAR|nr:DNA topoisomerase 1-like [Coffea arabica]XP_027068211.1 DNA topoisomerase 1-like [Coffea arabica]XP_027071518.1 DNA topoisomerase 1-like [Coffea arabica]XP_027071519.1 DNA topoisomerase 1-like [Coffea arabica]
MEKEEKNERGASMMTTPPETEFFLQWGNRKRLRCVRIRSNTSPPYHHHHHHHLSSSSASDLSSATTASTRIRRRITSSRFLSVSSHDEKQSSFTQPPSRLTRNSAEPAVTLRSESHRRVSPEEDRSYTTRGSVQVVGNLEDNYGGKVNHLVVDGHGGAGAAGISGGDGHNNNNSINGHNNSSSRGGAAVAPVWPKLYVALSSKEKEEDFMAMKGCKLPQRPKKRAKVIQRTLLLVSPGAWLTDMSLERYEVREKKISKKRPRGLKAMGNVESDSD